MKRPSWCSPWILVALFGLVSLFADVTYEGGRSIFPSFLTSVLGANIVLLGFGIGFAEFLGFAIRLASGLLTDITRRYWIAVFLGYSIVYAIPFIALAWNPYVALLLFAIERMGKAIRSPARDALLSSIARTGIGRGMIFGVHELMDQLGAVFGPGLAGLILYLYGDFRLAYMVLGVALTLALISLFFARICWYGLGLHVSETRESMRRQEVGEQGTGKTKLSLPLILYFAFVFVAVVSLVPYQIMLYTAQNIVVEWVVPIIYLVAQGVDAGSALIAGYSYDKLGLASLLPPIVLSPLTGFFLYMTLSTGSEWSLVAMAVVYGIVLGYHESSFRAVIGDLAPREYKATSYGIYYTVYGLGVAVIGGLASILYNTPQYIIIATSTAAALSLTLLSMLIRLEHATKTK